MQTLIELKRSIEEISDPEDNEITKAMLVLLAALNVGPDAELLAAATGYPHEFVGAMVTRMREADLWSDDAIDDREWLDENGELNGPGLLRHAIVALGRVNRKAISTGCIYMDPSSGKIIGEWVDPHTGTPTVQ